MPEQVPADTPFWRTASACTVLFVPGTRPDRFAKAAHSGADDIVLDLEDSVPATDKAVARQNVRRWIEQGGAGLVRINAAGSPWHDDDLAMITGPPRGVMLPKATSHEDVEQVVAKLPQGSVVIPTLETAAGILDARAIGAAPRVVRLAFGNGDLAAELGVDHSDWSALAWARSMTVLASAACRIAPPLDGVTTALDDDAVLADDCRRARAMGFGGKLCIHPKQIAIVQSEIGPSREQLEWARAVVEASAGDDVAVIDGHMVDRPIINRARRTLAWSEGPPNSTLDGQSHDV